MTKDYLVELSLGLYVAFEIIGLKRVRSAKSGNMLWQTNRSDVLIYEMLFWLHDHNAECRLIEKSKIIKRRKHLYKRYSVYLVNSHGSVVKMKMYRCDEITIKFNYYLSFSKPATAILFKLTFDTMNTS